MTPVTFGMVCGALIGFILIPHPVTFGCAVGVIAAVLCRNILEPKE